MNDRGSARLPGGYDPGTLRMPGLPRLVGLMNVNDCFGNFGGYLLWARHFRYDHFHAARRALKPDEDNSNSI